MTYPRNRTTCPTCARLVPANVDGSPKRHLLQGRYRMPGDPPCPGGAYDLHGILMTDPMSRAIREGRKTVTRRMSDKWGKVLVGDRLWVREVWRPVVEATPHGRTGCPIAYRATDSAAGGPWKSSLIMPFTVCRTILEVTEPVRREPVWGITNEEAVREGAYQTSDELLRDLGFSWSMGFDGRFSPSPRQAFERAWDALHPNTLATAEPWRIAFRVLP